MGYLGSFCMNLGNAGVPYIGALACLNSLNTVVPGSGVIPNYTYQAVATILLSVGLMCLNYIGIKESSSFNITLSIISVISEVALLFISFFIVWNYDTFVSSITSSGASGPLGVSWSNFGWGITVAMVSFIGLESISQAAEETKRPDKTIPKATLSLIVAVILAGMLLCILAVGLPAITPGEIGTDPERSGRRSGGRHRKKPACSKSAGIPPAIMGRFPWLYHAAHVHEHRRHRSVTGHLFDGPLPHFFGLV